MRTLRPLQRLLLVLALAASVAIPAALFRPTPGAALPGYAAATGQACGTCHVSPSGGGTLTGQGSAFAGVSTHSSDPAGAWAQITGAGTTATSTPVPSNTPVPGASPVASPVGPTTGVSDDEDEDDDEDLDDDDAGAAVGEQSEHQGRWQPTAAAMSTPEVGPARTRTPEVVRERARTQERHRDGEREKEGERQKDGSKSGRGDRD